MTAFIDSSLSGHSDRTCQGGFRRPVPQPGLHGLHVGPVAMTSEAKQ
jgi:hypothetical protein